MWNWGKSNPRAEGFCKDVYIHSSLFLFKLKNSETSQIFFNRVLSFREMFEQAFPYPDNIMPLFIYRKSIKETSVYAKAETEAKAKSFIPKNGETVARAVLVALSVCSRLRSYYSSALHK